MIQEPAKRTTNLQLNLNTWLLTICLGLSSWVLYSINQLDEEIAGIMPLINANASAIESINTLDKEQSRKIEEMDTRLTKLETQQADHSSKQ